MAEYGGMPQRIENYTALPSAGREPAVLVQLARIVQQSELFRKQLEELQMRLASVMGPDMPTLVNDPGNAKNQPTCELAGKMEHVANIIDGGNAILANMLKRLEI
jgi:hypothetical protein